MDKYFLNGVDRNSLGTPIIRICGKGLRWMIVVGKIFIILLKQVDRLIVSHHVWEYFTRKNIATKGCKLKAWVCGLRLLRYMAMVLRSYNTVVMITFVASKYKSRAYFRYSLCKFKIERQTPDFPLYVHVPVQNRGSQELFFSV